MPDEQRAVEIHELVYGSAARLLEPGASDLGVIASTRDFPADAARRLKDHRGFTRDGRTDGAVKYIVGVIGGRLEFTRIQMGTDHTGRTIPFARHLLLPLDGGNAWGDLVRRAAAHAQDPRQVTAGWIAPAPRLAPSRPSRPVGEALANVIAAAAETVIRYQVTKRPVLLVHAPPASPDPGADPFLGVFAAIGDVLPRSELPALVAVTHAVAADDRLAEASVLATYAGTPFHAEMTGRTGSRRPLVIDVAQATVEGATTPPSAFVKATVADLVAGRPGRFAGLCDRLRAKPDHWTLVAELDKARRGIEAQPGLASVEVFVTAVGKARGATAGAGLDRELLKGLAIETIGGVIESLARDAAKQADGTKRLGELLALYENLQVQASRAGIAAIRAGTRSEAKVLAQALAAVGDDAIVIVKKLAGDQPAGLSFLELVEPPAAMKAQGTDPGPIEVAERKRKPQRRDVTTGPRVVTGFNPRLGDDGAVTVGSPWWTRLIALVAFAPALVGVGYPVRLVYEPPPEAPDIKLVVTDPKPKPSSAGSEQNGNHPAKRIRWWDAAHREALRKAIKQATPQLTVPGILCVVALALLLLNGVLTRAAFAKLQPIGGGIVAAFLPTLVLFAVSATGGYLGYSTGVPRKGQDSPAKSEATTRENDQQAARGRSRQKRESSDKREEAAGADNQPRAESGARQQP